MKRIIIFLLFFIMGFTKNIYADYNAEQYKEEIKRQLDGFYFGDLKKAAKESGVDIDPRKIAEDTAVGEFKISIDDIISFILNKLFSEVILQADLMETIFGLCILCGILKFISADFSGNISSLGFYVCYISAIAVMTLSFSSASKIVLNTAEDFESIMNACVPLICGCVVSAGGVGGAAAMLPISAMITETAVKLAEIFFVPLINICGGVAIVNYFSQKPMLTKLSEFIQQIISWALKGFTFIAIGILGIYRIGNAASQQGALKVLKAGAGTIPIVGDILSGSIQTVALFGSLIKNGIGTAAAVLIAACAFVPFVKILAIVIAYKITAAVVQPIGEKGISECVDRAGSIISVMLGLLIMLGVVFISTVLIFISISGG